MPRDAKMPQPSGFQPNLNEMGLGDGFFKFKPASGRARVRYILGGLGSGLAKSNPLSSSYIHMHAK